MVVQALGEVPAELRVTPEQDERLAAQARAVAPADVVRLLELIAAALRALKDGADARTQLELALVKAAEPAHDPSAKALLARIERLEARARRRAPRPARAPASRAAGGAGRRAAGRTPRRRSHARRDRRRRAEARRAGRYRRRRRRADRAGVALARGIRARSGPAILESLEASRLDSAELLRQAHAARGGRRAASTARLARVGRVLQAPSRGSCEARADRAAAIRAVTGASLRLALRAARRRGARHRSRGERSTTTSWWIASSTSSAPIEEPSEES